MQDIEEQPNCGLTTERAIQPSCARVHFVAKRFSERRVVLRVQTRACQSLCLLILIWREVSGEQEKCLSKFPRIVTQIMRQVGEISSGAGCRLLALGLVCMSCK